MRLWARILISLVVLAGSALAQNRLFFGINGQASGPPPACSTTNYNVPFTLTENPISQSSCWVSGHSAGSCAGNFCWGDVQTNGTTGRVYGADQPPGFSDPTATLVGPWSSGTQTVNGTVFVTGTNNTCCKEVELRARTTISSGSINGYEMNCSIANDGTNNTKYIQIVRWNGAHNSFTVLAGPGGANGALQRCVNGDTLKLVVTGTGASTIINGYRNGTIINFNLESTGADTTNVPDTSGFSSGQPGVGFYDDVDTNWSNFGFSSWSATSP